MLVHVEGVDAADNARARPETDAEDNAPAPTLGGEGALNHRRARELAVLAGDHHVLLAPHARVALVTRLR